MAQSPSDAAARQARCIAGVLCEALNPDSVLMLSEDGACLEAAWSEACAGKLARIDIREWDTSEAASHFQSIDRIDIAHCSGLARIVPTGSECVLVNALALHADFVVFSLAGFGAGATVTPARDIQIWRDIFAAHGYSAFDCLRPVMARELRGDVLLFANLEGQLRMSEALQATALDPKRSIPHRGRIGSRFRHYLARLSAPRKARRRAA